MPPPYGPYADSDREQIVTLARGNDDLTFYARVEVQREGPNLTVVFEPEWVFVNPDQLVVDKVIVTLSEVTDPQTGLIKRKRTGRSTELRQGRSVYKAELGQREELLRDSPERRAALDFVDLALKRHGNFGGHGDLTAGIAPLCAANRVVVYDEPDVYTVTVNPRGPRGGEPSYDFRVRKRDGSIDELVVSVAPSVAEAPVPPTEPGSPKAALGEHEDPKTDQLKKPLHDPLEPI
jgi:hypothetical protein